MDDYSNDKQKAAKAERMLAAVYAHLSTAHRLRAVGMETGETRHFDSAESHFDEAESIGREAFAVVSFNVARYTVDAMPYQEALIRLLHQSERAPLYPEDVRRALKRAESAHLADVEELI